MERGEVVLLRGVHEGHVTYALPHRYALEHDGRLGLYLGLGTPGRFSRRAADGRYLERWLRRTEPDEHVWEHTNVLRLVRPGEAHSLDLFWDADWSFLGWYVNLQAPLRRSELGFDTTDWALDIVVDPHGDWQWKDEDDFAEAQALGILDAATAAAVRAEGERVIAARPWPTGLEAWRPDPAWPIPALPEGWERA